MVNIVNTISFGKLEIFIAATTTFVLSEDCTQTGHSSFVLVFHLHLATFGLNYTSSPRLAHLTSSQ